MFTKNAGEDGIEVRVQNHDVWLAQKAIPQLFNVEQSVVTKHLKNICESKELSEESTCANFAQIADNGKTYQYKFYSLSVIITGGISDELCQGNAVPTVGGKGIRCFYKAGVCIG